MQNDGKRRDVELGCPTLLIIAFIVMTCSNQGDTDRDMKRIERRLERIETKLERIEKRLPLENRQPRQQGPAAP